MHTLAGPFLVSWLARTSDWLCLFINTNPISSISLDHAGPVRQRSVWRQIARGHDLFRCWVALWPAVASRRGSGRVCLGAWGVFPTASGGLPPRLLLPSGRFGLSPGAWGAPNKGNADGAVGIFGNSGRVWATALRPVPPKNRPCAILARKVGRTTNTLTMLALSGRDQSGDRLLVVTTSSGAE